MESQQALDDIFLRRFKSMYADVVTAHNQMTGIISTTGQGSFTPEEKDADNSFKLALRDAQEIDRLLKARSQLNPWPMP